MRDQFNAVPIELEEAALVDGASVWISFFRIVLPIVLPGIASAFILCLILCWNEYFLASLITSTDAKTMPVMVASQISSQSIRWWTMAAVSAALCLPLIIIAIMVSVLYISFYIMIFFLVVIAVSYIIKTIKG